MYKHENFVLLVLFTTLFYFQLMNFYFLPVQQYNESDKSYPAAQVPGIDAPQTGAVSGYERFREQAAVLAAAMDDSTLAAQCLLAGWDNRPYLTGAMAAYIGGIPAGGVMLFGQNLDASKDEIRSFINDIAAVITAVSGVPPFVAVDHEGGLVHRFGPGIMRLPAPSLFWEMAKEDESSALRYLEELAAYSGMEMYELGFNLNLAPVAEILTPENSEFIGTRSFGPETAFTEKAASAFIRGMNSSGIACTLKHFPGSGSSDPHFESAVITQSIDQMILPFRGIIESINPAAVMVSHAIVTAVDLGVNASLSYPVITGLLKDELGFRGIALADDFSMSAITGTGMSVEEAVVRAFNSGIDMVICWPPNMASIHSALLNALDEGLLSRERLIDAAERILTQKLMLFAREF